VTLTTYSPDEINTRYVFRSVLKPRNNIVFRYIAFCKLFRPALWHAFNKRILDWIVLVARLSAKVVCIFSAEENKLLRNGSYLQK